MISPVYIFIYVIYKTVYPGLSIWDWVSRGNFTKASNNSNNNKCYSQPVASSVTKKGLLAAVLPFSGAPVEDLSASTYTRTSGDHLVNQQLQSVVEDTILKNIQYKVR